MANQNFDLTGSLQIRAAEEGDAENLHTYCLSEKTKKEVTAELKADLSDGSGAHRLVAEASGYAIGQIKIEQHPTNSEIGQLKELAVSGPFRQLGVADYLIKSAEATAAENGMTTLEIEIASTEAPVIDRYKEWGFNEKPVVTLQKTLDTDADATSGSTDSEAETATSGEQQELLNT